MTAEELNRQLVEAQAKIRALEEELAETNRGLVALTMELEQRVDERTAAWRESQATLEAALASMTDAVFISDAQGAVLRSQRRLCHVPPVQEQGRVRQDPRRIP